MPQISIIVPVYKVEQYLHKCLDSILAQTFTDWECILIDDGSPDNSGAICDEYAQQDSRFRVIHQENKGSAGARNVGLQMAHGIYLICVDSDDWVEPDYLECLYNEAERAGADVVFCDLFQEFNHHTQIAQEGKGHGCYVGQLLHEQIHGWLPVKLIRRSLLEDNGICWVEGLDMCEDVLIMTKVFLHTSKVVHLPIPLYHYRCTHDTSLTRRLNSKKILQLQRLIHEMETYLPSEYADPLKSFKSKTKVWILKSAEKLSPELINLYNNDFLSRCKYNSLSSRLFFFLCEHNLYGLVRFILDFKGRID